MVLHDHLKSLKPSDRVLEVGLGAKPHPRAEVCLDLRYSADAESIKQHAFTSSRIDTSKTVLYDGGRFPFADKEFDYVICSHVIEHVTPEELPLFLSELERVAGRGYLEFPSVLYELIFLNDVHRWLLNCRGKRILLLEKGKIHSLSGPLQKAYHALFFDTDRYMYNAFGRYPEVFFRGLEFQGRIDYEVVSDLSALFDDTDLAAARAYLTRFKDGGDLAVEKLRDRLAMKLAWAAMHPLAWLRGRAKGPRQG
ncbi:MAG TPA: class I SAM-dependent methyltransferase [Planctomycetota bacterium]|nr:class I SAM-dependent methyltransferase [Planctomycetota bacterium]